MIEIFHSTGNLGRILKEGLKAPYQLGLEGKEANYLSPEEVDKPTTPSITKFLHKAIFFFDEYPVTDEWVSILVDENDATIKVGNMNLVDVPYQPGKLYEKSVISLPTYLKRKNRPDELGKNFKNPFTAIMMDDTTKDRFKQKWGERLEQIICQDKSIFEYEAEILVPRLVIVSSDFHRSSRDD